MEKEGSRSVPIFLLRSAIIHTLTYFTAGMIASTLLDYRKIFEEPVIRDYMLGYGASGVVWGPWLQPLRGLVLGLAILPFRAFLAENGKGWLYLWTLFLCIGIVGTPAAAPASFEGLIYSKLPLWYHLLGLPEICLQTLAFSFLVHLYLRHPLGILHDLPPAFGSILQSIAGGCFAFVGYAASSIAFAFAAGVGLKNAEGAMNLRTQGLFIAPFIVNSSLIFASRSKRLPVENFLALLVIAYILNAMAVGAYQALMLGGLNPAYASLAPILPGLITAAAARRRD